MYLGLSLTALISAIAFFCSQFSWSVKLGFSAISFAIFIGMIFGNTFYKRIEKSSHLGVLFAKGTLLRTGIILYGFKITFQQISSIGTTAIIADVLMLSSTFLITLYLGIKLFKIDKQIVLLTAAGCSICGAAAIMATEPVVKGKSHKVAVAISIVVIYGTIAMFFYPFLYSHLQSFFSEQDFGVYIGSTIHEVAQVVAAGQEISPITANSAVITKMLRVMLIAPFLIILSNFISSDKKNITIPWFAVFFILVALFNSCNLLPSNIVKILIHLDNLCLIMAMAALGLTTNISAIKQAGIKPLYLGACTFAWLIIGGGIINYTIKTLF